VVDNVNIIKWSIHPTSLKNLSNLDFSSSNVAIVTTYQHLKHEKMLAFVGSIPSLSLSNDDHVLLRLFLETKVNPSEEDVNVQDFL